MAILAPTNANVEPNRLEQALNMLRSGPVRLVDLMAIQWQQMFWALWRNDGPGAGPAEKLEALGTDAAELFQYSADLLTFIIEHIQEDNPALAAKLQAIAAQRLAYTINEDGTVTLDPEEPPAEDPPSE